MKQIYVESYYRNGYSRFMQFINNILDHPKRQSIEKRLGIIKFCDEFGFEATKRAFGKSRSTVYLWKHKLKAAGGKLSALAPGDKIPATQEEEDRPPLHRGLYHLSIGLTIPKPIRPLLLQL